MSEGFADVFMALKDVFEGFDDVFKVLADVFKAFEDICKGFEELLFSVVLDVNSLFSPCQGQNIVEKEIWKVTSEFLRYSFNIYK